MELQYITLSTGIRMNFVESGAANGKPVVFLHGGTDTKRSFYPLMKLLGELRPDLRLIAVDQRGHGASSMPAPKRCAETPEKCFQFSELALDILAFMDQTNIDNAYIVGHSMGSFVAQEMAFVAPDRIDRLVLIGTAAKPKDNPVLRDFILVGLIEQSWKNQLIKKGRAFPSEAYRLTPIDVDPDVGTWMAANWVADPVADPEFLAEILPETCRIPIGTWLGAMLNLLELDNRERLKTLEVPVLALWATQDSIFLDHDQQELLASLEVAARTIGTPVFWKPYGKQPLPKSGVQENDIGHNLHWGAPEGVARDLAAYLTDNGAPTNDLYYASPKDVRAVLKAPGEAAIFQKPEKK